MPLDVYQSWLWLRLFLLSLLLSTVLSQSAAHRAAHPAWSWSRAVRLGVPQAWQDSVSSCWGTSATPAWQPWKRHWAAAGGRGAGRQLGIHGASTVSWAQLSMDSVVASPLTECRPHSSGVLLTGDTAWCCCLLTTVLGTLKPWNFDRNSTCFTTLMASVLYVRCRVHQPLRQCLGWLLLQEGRLDEAWKAYSQVSRGCLWRAWDKAIK